MNGHKDSKGHFHPHNNHNSGKIVHGETISEFGFSDKELAQQKKKANLDYIQRGRVEHIESAIDHLKEEHGHKPMIGAKKMNPQDRVRLHNQLVDFYKSNTSATEDFPEKTKELLDRLPHHDSDALMQLASDGAFMHKMDMDDYKKQQRDLHNMDKNEKDDFGQSWNSEEKERKQAEKLYDKKYNKWGIKR